MPTKKKDLELKDLELETINVMPAEVQSAQSLAPAQTLTPQQMLSTLVQQGADPAVLEKFMDLAERWDANQAKKAYFLAVSKFKENPPVVTKDRKNDQYNSYYTSKGNLLGTVNPMLGKQGLSASYEYKQTENLISVKCVLSHKAGHSECVTLSGPPDKSGAKNTIQQIKSTITYLEIVTYSAVTGTASNEAADDDGATSEPPGNNAGTISKEQENTIHSMITDNGLDMPKFLKYIKQKSIETIPAASFNYCIQEIKAAIKKRSTAKKKAAG